jgi:hypothetical protein
MSRVLRIGTQGKVQAALQSRQRGICWSPSRGSGDATRAGDELDVLMDNLDTHRYRTLQ